jgi:hypothetical protein
VSKANELHAISALLRRQAGAVTPKLRCSHHEGFVRS